MVAMTKSEGITKVMRIYPIDTMNVQNVIAIDPIIPIEDKLNEIFQIFKKQWIAAMQLETDSRC